jgi:hypothetical protein
MAQARRREWDLIVDFQTKAGLTLPLIDPPTVWPWPENTAVIKRELLTLAGHIAATSEGVGAIGVKEFLKAWPHYVGLCLLGEGQRHAMRLAFGRTWSNKP